jgi:2-polyprenyl-6-methoxyphenol hydroxylase-like FAD-dependent oxidoreductase
VWARLTVVSAAGALARVVDRQMTGANTSRAAVAHARTLEMLGRIGVSKRLAGLGVHARQFSIRDGDRELVQVRFDSTSLSAAVAGLHPGSVRRALTPRYAT